MRFLGRWAAGAVQGMALAILAALVPASSARAETPAADPATPAVLVELYTSQGCVACPPADALLAELSLRADVVALALHVDYWDYIGWSDPFALPAHTARQKAYARAAGARSIYTPQMIIDGRVSMPGNRRAQVLGAIEEARATARPVRIEVLETGADGARRIAISALRPLGGAVLVQLVRFRPEASVQISAGENRGRRSNDHNIVTDWSVVAQWDGTAPLALTLPPIAQGPVAVVVQEAGPGAVLASAAFR